MRRPAPFLVADASRAVPNASGRKTLAFPLIQPSANTPFRGATDAGNAFAANPIGGVVLS